MAMIRKITADMNAQALEEDLVRYREKAIELGASRAKIVLAEEIPVDERVTLKCRIPRCFGYGAGAHCPPNTLKPSELQELLTKYKWAIFFVKDVPAEVIARNKETIKERVAVYQEIYKIVSSLESMAFYDGHYLAFGFAAGSCRHTFCGQQKDCQAMQGDKCRFPLIAPAVHGGGGYRRV